MSDRRYATVDADGGGAALWVRMDSAKRIARPASPLAHDDFGEQGGKLLTSEEKPLLP
jgi:hypothetical protein